MERAVDAQVTRSGSCTDMLAWWCRSVRGLPYRYQSYCSAEDEMYRVKQIITLLVTPFLGPVSIDAVYLW